MTSRSRLFLAACLAAASVHAEPYRFDADDDYLAPAALWNTWQATVDAYAADLAKLANCTAESDCSGRFRALNHLLERIRDLEPDKRVRAVNAWVNRMRYRDDRTQTGPDGRLPNEFRSLSEFTRRGGDCEDFAIAKYFLLREAGIPAARMRVVVARDRPHRAYHAVLAYDAADGAWLVETDGTIRRSNHGQYRFLYAMNEEGVWDHAPAEGAPLPRHL